MDVSKRDESLRTGCLSAKAQDPINHVNFYLLCSRRLLYKVQKSSVMQSTHLFDISSMLHRCLREIKNLQHWFLQNSHAPWWSTSSLITSWSQKVYGFFLGNTIPSPFNGIEIQPEDSPFVCWTTKKFHSLILLFWDFDGFCVSLFSLDPRAQIVE